MRKTQRDLILRRQAAPVERDGRLGSAVLMAAAGGGGDEAVAIWLQPRARARVIASSAAARRPIIS